MVSLATFTKELLSKAKSNQSVSTVDTKWVTKVSHLVVSLLVPLGAPHFQRSGDENGKNAH